MVRDHEPIVGFLFSRVAGLEGETIALTGAVVLMIVAREDVHKILKTVEWPTLVFLSVYSSSSAEW